MNELWYQWISQSAGNMAWLDQLMIVLANDAIWLMPAILIVLWLTGREKNQRVAFYACLSASAALLAASQLLSPVVDHPRPFVVHAIQPLISHAADASFPSDHATFAFAVWFVKRRLGSVLIGLTLLIGIARVYVSVHYPADILGGAVLAFVCYCVIRKLSTKLDPLPDFFIRIYGKMVAGVPISRQKEKRHLRD